MNLTDQEVKEVITIIHRFKTSKGLNKSIEEINQTLTDAQRVLDIYRGANELNEALINACLDTININTQLLNKLNKDK